MNLTVSSVQNLKYNMNGSKCRVRSKKEKTLFAILAKFCLLKFQEDKHKIFYENL
jgi:hypothetical protein